LGQILAGGWAIIASKYSPLTGTLAIQSRMCMYIKVLTIVLVILSFQSNANISVTAVHNSTNELKIKSSLESLQKKYDLTPWIITETIEVNENANIPFSHPILTMTTDKGYIDSEVKLLSAFLHEQFHWHVIKNGKGSKEEFRKGIKTEFPNVQFERPFGSGTEGGTLSHIIVCYLEYVVLSELIGKEKASENISKKQYYTWVYQTVIDPKNRIKLDKLVKRFGLEFNVKNS
jgi:hypothetical protein